jgi:hypothetical protein
MTKDEAMDLALEALEELQPDDAYPYSLQSKAITAIKQARSAPLHDAFAQLMRDAEKPISVPESIAKYAAALVAGTHEITSLTIQPKRQWIGLTDEEHTQIAVDVGCMSSDWLFYGAAVERALKNKNT